MPLSSVVAFWGVAALLIAVPGPDWAFAISAGLRREAVPAASGLTLGYIAMTIVVAAGAGALIASTPAALTVLTIAGGLYLVWIGARTLRRPAATPTAGQHHPGTTRINTVFRGMTVSGLNPKGLLMFVAILPQFTLPEARWPLPIQIGTLGAAYAVTCAVVYVGVGTSAQRLLQARPTASRLVSRISGASMVLVGATLLIERIIR